MEVRIAIATTDGKVVNQHFGKADRFYIILANSETGKFNLFEERRVKPVCQGGDHEEKQLTEGVKSLHDCQYVLVSRIGIRASREFEKAGIQVFELPGLIEESVDKMLKYIEIQKLMQG